MRRKLLTEADVEARYGLPKKTLQWRRYMGQPPVFLKIGSRVYYREKDLETFLDEARRRSTADAGVSP